MYDMMMTVAALATFCLWTAFILWAGIQGERIRMRRAWHRAAERLAEEARAARTPYKREPQYPRPDETTRKAAQA